MGAGKGSNYAGRVVDHRKRWPTSLARDIKMAERESVFDSTKWRSLAKSIVVDIAKVIAALFGVGLLIVNMDLGRYGVVELELARPEYVLVGLLWAVLVGGTLTLLVLVFELFRDWRHHASLASHLLPFVLVYLYLQVLLGITGPSPWHQIFTIWFAVLLFSLFLPAIFFGAIAFLTSKVLEMLQSIERDHAGAQHTVDSSTLNPLPLLKRVGETRIRTSWF